jgi:alkylation response protein AidB-like acyl-CoA dehydrogenase
MKREIFEPEHEDLREVVRRFLQKESVPYKEEWEEAGMVPRSFWKAAAKQGLVGFEVPTEYGGQGLRDIRFNAVIVEEVAYTGAVGDNFGLQNDILAPYLIELTNDEQKQRWLPPFCAGDLLAAIAMTEPGAGSDLRGIRTKARKDGSDYIIDGSKTFVTSGIAADLVVAVARTSGDGKDGFSLLAVEKGTPGLVHSRKLEKVGRWATDTAELFFDEVRVPAENLIGEEGQGLPYLMRNLPRERLSIAVTAIADAERAIDLTLEYVKERKAFGQPIGSFQVSRHALAELVTKLAAARSHVDRCLVNVNASTLTAEEAAGAKALTTNLQNEVIDRCLQLHGGYGYMREYEISRLWRDARVQRIYGGANEIMHEIVGRSLGL